MIQVSTELYANKLGEYNNHPRQGRFMLLSWNLQSRDLLEMLLRSGVICEENSGMPGKAALIR